MVNYIRKQKEYKWLDFQFNEKRCDTIIKGEDWS